MTTLMMIIIIEIIPAFPQLGIALGFVLPAIIVRDQVMETRNIYSSRGVSALCLSHKVKDLNT